MAALLPSVLLRECMLFLPGMESWVPLRLVCRSWRRVAAESCNGLVLTSESLAPGAASREPLTLALRGAEAASLRVYCLSTKRADWLESHGSRLRRLRLELELQTEAKARMPVLPLLTDLDLTISGPYQKLLESCSVYGDTLRSLDVSFFDHDALGWRGKTLRTMRDFCHLSRLSIMIEYLPDDHEFFVDLGPLQQLEHLTVDTYGIPEWEEGEGLRTMAGIEQLCNLRVLQVETNVYVTEHLASLPKLRQLSLVFVMNSEAAMPIVAKLSLLEEFHFGWMLGSSVSKSTWAAALLQLPSLRLLSPPMALGPHTLPPLPCLTDLWLRYLDRCKPARIANLAAFTGLVRLTLVAAKKLYDADLRHLAGMRSLEYLDLTACGRLTDGCLVHLADMAQLRSLYLTRLKQLTGAGMRSLAAWWPRLETLRLDRCSRLRVEEAVQGLPRSVTRLALGGTRVSVRALELLAVATPRLVLLDLSGASLAEGCAHVGFRALGQGCPRLTSLGLWWRCPQADTLRGQSVAAGLSHCTGLTSLNIDRPGVSARTVALLVTRLGWLRTLTVRSPRLIQATLTCLRRQRQALAPGFRLVSTTADRRPLCMEDDNGYWSDSDSDSDGEYPDGKQPKPEWYEDSDAG